LWTDVRTYVTTDRHLRPTLLGQLGGVDLKINRNLRVTLEYFIYLARTKHV